MPWENSDRMADELEGIVGNYEDGVSSANYENTRKIAYIFRERAAGLAAVLEEPWHSTPQVGEYLLVRNVSMLASFCYLFMTSILLFMKVVLFVFKEKYIGFSTFLMVIFSSYYHFESIFGNNFVSSSIINSIMYFRCKSYSY